MMKAEIKIQFREAVENDLEFVFSSWLHSYRVSPLARTIPKTSYYEGHHKVIERLVVKSRVICAVDPEDSNHIYGWCCWENSTTPVLHYVYVKFSFRRLGIGSRLIEPVGTEFLYTHETAPFKALCQAGKYNPYLALGE
jgi:GNAT superfamily N-acetyltransferase